MSLAGTEYWQLIHAERARLAKMLEELSESDWSVTTLSSAWSVQDVVAHLSAAANIGTFTWFRSMILAGFKPEKHNQRQLEKYLCSTPDETLELFRNSINSTTAPTKDYPAWLGEVIVHGQDIAQALSLRLTPDPDAVKEVATYYVGKDFAVNSKSMVAGLTLEATDAEFRTGEGPLVQGRLLDLVMAMSGRPTSLARLEGEGVAALIHRMES